MQTSFEFQKDAFKLALVPIFELLSFKKILLSSTEWLAFVERTQASIIRCPDQFLGNELPPPLLIEQLVNEIMYEFHMMESPIEI